jgi:ferredoxin
MTARFAVVDDVCEGHALCTSFAPGVFELDDDEQAHAPDGPLDPDQVPAVERAIAACPVQAIRMEERA